MDSLSVGFALTGSYCTFRKVIPQISVLRSLGYNVIPIVSQNVFSTDTRFGKAADFVKNISEASGNEIIASVNTSEPIGPKNLLDALIIAPCTGNTLGKIANGITDTSVTMAAKATLRNEKPVVIAISTNDGLAASAKNIGLLLNSRNIFFVPFRQDDYTGKPRSLVAEMELIPAALSAALEKAQVQPVLLEGKSSRIQQT